MTAPSVEPPPTASLSAVEASGIQRRFGRSPVLRGLNLVVAAGSTLALFGPNGAGKTTLLRILALVLRPSAGRVRIFGAGRDDSAATALGNLGFLSHETALYLDLTPEENLIFSARLHGLAHPRERAREALAEVGLGGERPPARSLSRGQQQRTALARAMLHAPKLLILDEPFTGLDPDARRVLGRRLEQHRAAGGTTVFTTHDIGEGYEIADRIGLLAHGRVTIERARAEIPPGELERELAAAARAGAAS